MELDFVVTEVELGDLLFEKAQVVDDVVFGLCGGLDGVFGAESVELDVLALELGSEEGGELGHELGEVGDGAVVVVLEAFDGVGLVELGLGGLGEQRDHIFPELATLKPLELVLLELDLNLVVKRAEQ